MKKLTIALIAIVGSVFGVLQAQAYTPEEMASAEAVKLSKATSPEGGRFKVLVDGDYNVGTANNAQATLTFNYVPAEKWMIGLGAGSQFFNGKYDFVNLPLYLYGRFYVNTDHDWRPYIDCRLGYSFGFNNHENAGHLIANPTFGFSIKMSDMSAFNIGMGANYGWDPHRHISPYQRNLISFNIRLGFEFGEW